MENIAFTDHDYFQYAKWGYQKPTRFWGSEHIRSLKSKCCDGRTCANLRAGKRGHLERLGGRHMKSTRKDKYRIPEPLIEYLCRLDPREGDAGQAASHLGTMRVTHMYADFFHTNDELEEAKHEVQKLGFLDLPDLEWDGDSDDISYHPTAEIAALAQRLLNEEKHFRFVRGWLRPTRPGKTPSSPLSFKNSQPF